MAFFLDFKHRHSFIEYLYITKVEKKGRIKSDIDKVIFLVILIKLGIVRSYSGKRD